jgi:protein-S-isoprenylcysteine O-methyltransferase Ste14
MNAQTPPLDTAHRLVIGYGNWLFRYREMVFPIVVIVLFAGFPQVVPWGDHYLDLWMDLLGLLVAGLGQAVRVAVVGLTSIKRAGMNKQIYADRLVTDGIFAHVRNPLYLGNLLILIGLFIIHNNPFVYVLGSLFFLSVYCSLVAAEEAFLLQKFGAD